MSTSKFKTNIKCAGCVATVTPGLNQTAGEGKWEVDLGSPERILTVSSEVSEQQVKEALKKAGYKGERID
ncbi:MAG TPA: heavy-metal-associated domain-containing protein [Cyclobacteriaceae bacterium]|nr:heavy-metal-associated domain-containing protein [Cyclobacteriaceae bacterium]HRJ82958.1 heavy-metal-associated domain-containing protein [Cyclobacteriaceae bacterium]